MKSDRSRELALGLVILLVAAAGVAVDVLGGEIEAPEGALSGDAFEERSIFCLPVPGDEETLADATAHIVGSPMGDDEVAIRIEPSGSAPESIQGNLVARDVEEATPVRLTGYGGRVEGSTFTNFRSPATGLGAASCSRHASDRWFFPAGSSARGFNEWIVLYNPFPDEAVVRVDFFTEEGLRSKSALADVAVPAGRLTTVRVNEHLLQQRGLGVGIRALRGRVTSWKVMFAKPEGRPQGVGMTLGARAGARDWWFPVGSVGAGASERISVLNPTGDEALVTVSLVTDKEALQPPELVEMPIPAQTAIELNLADVVGDNDLGGTSVVVRSVNEVPIVVERSIFYSDGEFSGFTTEVGVSTPSEAWWVGPGGANSDRDALILMNTTEEDVTADVVLFTGQGQPISGGILEGLQVPGGGRLRVPLDDVAGAGASVAYVTASGNVVVERVTFTAATNDVATIMGLPQDR